MKVIGNLNVKGKHSILKFNPNPENDLEYSGWITSELVGVNVVPGNALYYDISTQLWKLAQANSSSTLPCRGISLETKTSGEYCNILRYGTLKNINWTLTNTGLYVSPSTAGAIQLTQPTGSGQFVQMIATPCGSNVAFFDFCSIFVEIA